MKSRSLLDCSSQRCILAGLLLLLLLLLLRDLGVVWSLSAVLCV
jgi:hypothetical protein